MNILRKFPDWLWITVLGGIFFLPFLGSVRLFDWDEVNFAESAREMIVSGNYTTVQIDFQPFWEKPPLFFWLQVLAMKLFGINEFAARLPNALIGIITLITLYFVGKQLKDRLFGWLWALAYLGSFAPHFYFKTALIDPTFNYFIFLSIWFTYRASISTGDKPQAKARPVVKTFAVLAGVFMGLALLTKGPVAGLLWVLTVGILWAVNRFGSMLSFKQLLLFGLTTLLVAATWSGLEFYQHGFWFFEQFISYQIRLFSTPDSGHGQPFYYHFVVVLVGCFPASIFAIRYLTRFTKHGGFATWLLVLFWVVMILFSIVTTKIVHYSSMAWYPVTFFAALHLHTYLKGSLSWSKWTTAGLITVGLVLSLALIGLPLVGMYAFEAMPYIKDAFVVGNLQAAVHWAGWEWAIGLGYLVALLVGIRWLLSSLQKNYRFKGAFFLFATTAICIFCYSIIIVPKIEQYVQGSPLDFYQSKAGQNVYVGTVGFKSYAHLFYFDKQPCPNPQCADENWLLNGEVDKPNYFVTKITEADNYRNHPNLQWIKEENGFVFLKRRMN